MIISVSRRTDVPAYYSEWFINSLNKGRVDVANPFNKNQISRISLLPKDVDCFVFWTKNPTNIIPYLSELDCKGYKYYFQFTLNPYDNKVEKNLPSKSTILDTFKLLSNYVGSERVLWRYDPIILTPNYSIDYHLKCFEKLSAQLKGFTNRVTISFVDPYKKIMKNLNKINYYEPDIKAIGIISKGFSKIAKESGMEIYSCSEKIDLEKNGVKKGACIDPVVLRDVLGINKIIKSGQGQRDECQCAKSRDIGFYNSCKSGCIYCYALR